MTIDDKSSIYVGGLPYEATEETLRRVFLAYGEILAVKIINDRGTRGKCYGFVTFEDPRSAIDAIDDMDGRTIGDRFVRVNGVKSRFGRIDFDRENDRGRRRERDYDHERDRFRDRSDERLRDHDRPRERNMHNHDRDRDNFLDTGHDRNLDRNWEKHNDLDSDRETDRNNENGRFFETNGKRKSRKLNGSVTIDGQSREILLNLNDHSDEQVEDEILRSTQRLEELKKEVVQMEEGLEQKGDLVLELQQKSKKLEELLINAKMANSHSKTQLTKLHKCFLQVRDYTEKLKSSEKELQNHLEMAVSEDIIEANGEA